VPSEISHRRDNPNVDSGLERLISKLNLLSKPAPPASCFVLLWTYFEKYGLQSVENTRRAQGKFPHDLKAFSSSFGSPKTSDNSILKLINSSKDRELFALRWLKTLDQKLDGLKGVIPDTILGIDDEPYRIVLEIIS
jgi:hypothetical protein